MLSVKTRNQSKLVSANPISQIWFWLDKILKLELTAGLNKLNKSYLVLTKMHVFKLILSNKNNTSAFFGIHAIIDIAVFQHAIIFVVVIVNIYRFVRFNTSHQLSLYYCIRWSHIGHWEISNRERFFKKLMKRKKDNHYYFMPKFSGTNCFLCRKNRILCNHKCYDSLSCQNK